MITNSFLRKSILFVWISILGIGIISYLLHPSFFTPQHIALFLKQFSTQFFIIYFFLFLVRGLVLLPSTPLVLAGSLLFPDNPFVVLAISMTGIMFSAVVLYFFSQFLGFSEYFENHQSKRLQQIHQKLNTPIGFLFIIFWAFFPFVPTDAVCYAAGMIKMHVLTFLLGIFIGELILCSLCIFGIRLWFS